MGRDIVPAFIINETNDPIKIIVVNGDAEGAIEKCDLAVISNGEISTSIFRSIDAFGVYHNDASMAVIFQGRRSSWWRICDSTQSRLCLSGDDVELELIEPHPWINPTPTTPHFWGISLDDIQHLLLLGRN